VTHRRTTIWLVASLAVVVVVAGLGEVGLRKVLTDRIRTSTRNVLGGSAVDVGIGARPALVDAATGQISAVSLRATSASVCDLSDLDIEAKLSDLRRHGSGAHAEQVDVAITLSGSTLSAAASSAVGGKIASLGILGSGLSAFSGIRIQPDPAHNQLVMQAGPAGIVKLAESVRLDGRVLRMQPTLATLAGRAVPPATVGQLVPRAALTMNLSALPLDLVPTSATVTAAGLRITLHAADAELPKNAVLHCPKLF
jgi:hypothetical protein